MFPSAAAFSRMSGEGGGNDDDDDDDGVRGADETRNEKRCKKIS